MKIDKSSGILAKYSALYKKNPSSKVFAPLAESYRKLGLYDEAYKILENGIKNHPEYVLGYVVLAHCYFDQKKYELAYTSIKPMISRHRDNISLQKLYADISLELNNYEEALETFKYVLFLNPHDPYAAKQVKLLEDDVSQKMELEIESRKIKAKTVELDDDIYMEDAWEQVDFSEKKQPVQNEEEPLESEEFDEWELKAPVLTNIDKFKNDVSKNNLDVESRNLEDDYFEDEEYTPESEQENEVEDDVILIKSKEESKDQKGKDSPFINHTLVDLYIKQGHTQKAIEILENILDLHPEDHFTRNRLEVLTSENEENTPMVVMESPEEEDRIESSDEHENLLNLVEENVKYRKSRVLLEKKLNQFLAEIKNHSLQKNNPNTI